MASKKKKRVRRRLNWGPILVILVITSVVTGVLYSPLTALRRLRVESAPLDDQARLEAILKREQGRAFANVRALYVEGEVVKNPRVEAARFVHNPFGSGHLAVSYRTPVARLEGAYRTAVDENGVAFQQDDLPPDLPLIRLPDHDLRSGMGIAGTTSLRDLVELVNGAKELNLTGTWFAEVREDRSLCLNTEQGLVILGTSDRLDEKLAKLKELLARSPSVWTRTRTINLMSPKHPTGVKPAPNRREPLRQ